MQISKINSVNFCGAKNAKAVQKAVKPVVNEVEADFSRYAYAVPTGKAVAAKPAAVKQTADKAADYFYYGNPTKTVKEVQAASAADAYSKETQQIISEEVPEAEYKFVTDSMNF